jgi:transposase
MRMAYVVRLSEAERRGLERVVTAGQTAARTLTHAYILLKADAGAAGPGWRDAQITEAFGVSASTVVRVRRRYATRGLEAALHRQRPRRVYRRRLDGEQEAHLVAVACSAPPAGRKRWTLRLLAQRAVELELVEEVSYETVRRVMKKTR